MALDVSNIPILMGGQYFVHTNYYHYLGCTVHATLKDFKGIRVFLSSTLRLMIVCQKSGRYHKISPR